MASPYELSPPPMWRRRTSPDILRISKRQTSQRDSASARNVKTWTLEDERLLLQGRLERLPYKQIGAKLGKTDLACRLHFHQMVMAKRTPQTPPGRSIVFLSSEHPPEVHRLTPANTSSTLKLPNLHLLPHNTPAQSVTGQSTMHQLSGQFGHRRSISWSESSTLMPDRSQSPSPPSHSPSDRRMTSSVDLGKLNSIYQEHAEDFWSTIAAKYSGNDRLTPSELELAFFSARGTDSYDVPTIVLSSPDSPEVHHIEDATYSQMCHTETAMTDSELTIAGKCSVESLLNHAH